MTTTLPAGRPRPFGIERWFAEYEFTLRHHLSCSDCETVPMGRLVQWMEEDAECKAMWEGLQMGYTESLGLPALREAVRRKYRATARKNMAVAAGPASPYKDGFEVMTCVPLEGIVITMNALLDPGDCVIAMEPCYQVLSEMARARGCTVMPWEARYCAETGLFRFHAEDFTALVEAAAAAGGGGTLKMAVVNTPHNPSGHDLFSTDGGVMDVVASQCAAGGVTLFSDEMYAAILDDFEGAVEETVLHSNVARPKTVVLSGLSKPQGLPGLRSGWLLVSDPVQFDLIAQQKDYASICGVAPGEVLSLIALRREGCLVRPNQARVAANLALFKAFCDEFGGRYFTTPCTTAPACTLFVALGSTALARFGTTHHFTEALAKRFGVGVLPGEVMWTAEPCDGAPARAQAVRIGLGREDFADALDACRKALQTLDQEEEPMAGPQP